MTTTNAAKAAEYSAHPTTHPENTQQESSTQDSNQTSKSMRDSNPTLTQKLESLNPQTQKAAKQAAEGFNGFLRNTFINMLEQGQRLNELQARMQSELGKKEGSIAFKIWLNSEEWDYTRTLAQTLMTIAKKYSKLPGKLKNQLRDKLNGWSLTAIKELLSAGKDIINKFKNRPTSAAAIQRAKKEEARKQQPVTNWTEVQVRYKNLTAQDLEAIKQEAEKEARKHNRPVQTQDIEKVADEFGFKKAKKPKTTSLAGTAINETKERIANYAIRQAQLEEAFKTAPGEIKDNLALQIQGCKRAIAELSKGLDIETNIPSEETSPTQAAQDPELLQRIADLEQLVEALHRQNEDLMAKKSYSEPAPSDSTIETLEQKLQQLTEENEQLKLQLNAQEQPVTSERSSDLKDLNEKLLQEVESLKKQITKTPIQQPNEIADIKTIKAILKSSFNSNWSIEDIERQSQLPLKTVLNRTNFAIDQLETSCHEWQQKFESTSQSLTTIEEELRLLKARQDALAKENDSTQQTLEHLLKLDSLQKPEDGDQVLVTQGPLKGVTGVLFGTNGPDCLITTPTGNTTYTRSTEYEYLVKIG